MQRFKLTIKDKRRQHCLTNNPCPAMDASSTPNPDLSTPAADPAPLSTEAEAVPTASASMTAFQAEINIARLTAELENATKWKNELAAEVMRIDGERAALDTQLQAATKASAALASKHQIANNQILLLQADNRAIRLMYDAVSPLPLVATNGREALANYNKPGLMVTADTVAELSVEELHEDLVQQRELMRSMQALHKHMADELRATKDSAAKHNEAISALKNTHAMHLSQERDNHVEALAKQQRIDIAERAKIELNHRNDINAKDREIARLSQQLAKLDTYKRQRNGLRGDLFAAKAELAAAKAELASTKAKMDEQARGSSITMALLEARKKLEEQQHKRTAEQADDDEPSVSASKRRAAADDDDDEPAMPSPSKRPADDEESD
jgi:chromosome segregation ATPase